MKTKLSFLVTVIFLSICTVVSAQEVLSLRQKDNSNKLDVMEKDTAFCNSFFDENGGKVAFSQKEDLEMFSAKWSGYLKAMGEYFTQKDFPLNEKIYFRIFFDRKGNALHIFYSPQGNKSNISKGKNKTTFEKLLKDFAAKYSLEVESPYNFKQCGSAMFQKPQSTKHKKK